MYQIVLLAQLSASVSAPTNTAVFRVRNSTTFPAIPTFLLDHPHYVANSSDLPGNHASSPLPAISGGGRVFGQRAAELTERTYCHSRQRIRVDPSDHAGPLFLGDGLAHIPLRNNCISVDFHLLKSRLSGRARAFGRQIIVESRWCHSPMLRDRREARSKVLDKEKMITRHCRNNILLVVLYFFMPDETHSHGRLMDPPSRNAMWRFGYPNPVNYNDNELFCGGYAVHWQQNKGKCGVCGDAYHLIQPRPHEAGGEFAKGIIVRHYTVGQEIEVEVELTANHYGRFEILLCPNNDPSRPATQECFDSHPLYVSGTQDVRFEIPRDTGKKGVIRYAVTLPPFVTCSQCVIQWNYYTGNMWGTCENGTEAVGCGRPETFRNCADVRIVTSTGAIPPRILFPNIFFPLYSIASKLMSIIPLAQPLRAQVCEPTAPYRYRQNMSDWCQANCIRVPSNCPPGICRCLNTCDAIGDIADKPGADQYCLKRCMRYPSNCPTDRCNCY